MKINAQNGILLVYLILTLVHLWGTYNEDSAIIFFTKPFLLVLLAIYFMVATVGYKGAFRMSIILALLFSSLGDTLLMFTESETAIPYFILGLGAFLIAHLWYVRAFLKVTPLTKGFIQQKPIVLLPLLAYLGMMWWLLIPNLGSDFKVPVIAYSLVIISMVFAAINLYRHIPNTIWQGILIGAVLFVLSDSLIAVGKFDVWQMPTQWHRLSIMFTYLLAQLLLSISAVKLYYYIKKR